MLRWLRARRRRKRAAEPFPDAWEQHIARNVAHDRVLDAVERTRLRRLVRDFVAEKRWEGCGGQVLDDEIRVTIAAQACLLALGLPGEPFRRVRTILVYPSTVVLPPRPPGALEIATRPIASPLPILGQALRAGPIVLAWDAVRRTARHPESGHNLVYHEFAHALDLQDGAADGTPPLAGREEYARWVQVFDREYRALRERVRSGRPGLLDGYGAVAEAEFFAVATEAFFDRPLELRRRHAELYEVLRSFYRQDPGARMERAGDGTVGDVRDGATRCP